MKAIKGFFKKPDNSIIDNNMNDDIHYIDSFRVAIRNQNRYSIDYLTALFFSSIPVWVNNFRLGNCIGQLNNIIMEKDG